jgi:hypothetical protein
MRRVIASIGGDGNAAAGVGPERPPRRRRPGRKAAARTADGLRLPRTDGGDAQAIPRKERMNRTTTTRPTI